MTKYFHNHPSLKSRRRGLRNNMTLGEITLWKYLRGSQLGFKFRRQSSIGPYILDFYCPKNKLIIEIDGSEHLNAKDYDEERDRFLLSQGYRVVRFTNKKIIQEIKTVLTKINLELGTYAK